MSWTRADVPPAISSLLDDRPVRWLPADRAVGDYDGRERTLEVFNAAANEQRPLLRSIRPKRALLESAVGGPVVVIFHTPAESLRLHADFLAEWAMRGTADIPAAVRRCLELDEEILWTRALFGALSDDKQRSLSAELDAREHALNTAEARMLSDVRGRRRQVSANESLHLEDTEPSSTAPLRRAAA